MNKRAYPIDKETKICISIAERPGSFGAEFHNLGYQFLGLNFLYFPRQVSSSELPQAIQAVKTFQITGCSVSMPHKEKVIELLDRLDHSAGKVGAVNTIKNEQGVLTGYNTDFYGAKRAIEETVPIEGKQVVMIGAGGVAKAIAYAVKELGGNLTIINRNPKRAHDLAGRVGAKVLAWEKLPEIEGDLLIQATPAGMHQSQYSLVSKELIDRFSAVQEVVLDPVETLLVKQALGLEKIVINGSAMCYYQASEQFKIYTGIQAPLDQIRQAISWPSRVQSNCLNSE